MTKPAPGTPNSDLGVQRSALNVERSAAAASAPSVTVDAQHPWLGLVSFTEETRSYFHGREEEAAELGRRVQRKLLTVLFGQSGLGKTSILQAGLVPRLRPEGFCPVYVRLDYDPHSPPPAEQIKRAVFRATGAAGTWTQTGAAVTGETLWEFLHHRDDVLKDAGGRTLIPILIFDQFEEIFTLAQTDDAGRSRAQEFLADLADLVENRPPAALEARIDRDEADAAKFDFARADYRILISLREDYLAHLEGLKAQMPSVTQNRMRLARMTGAQAVAAVRAPAPHLVGEAVAEAVVRFVAGGADLSHAEVEPSLLSLICRELNNTRLAQGQAEISATLLAGSRDTILTEFYERALADQPPGVRIFIEDVLLTDSGFRESVAEERVRKGFAAAGAAPDALAKLVDRRLLRVEDRLDLRRVEITHDVLCSVVGASRSVRHEREALEESKRQLAAQREREVATHRALLRARFVAAVASVLMLVAAGSAVFGWINLRRARAADAEAQAARQLTERARGQAEKLVGFLLEDFYEELKPTGRVEIVGKLADKAVAYYDGLPPELMTAQTKVYRGLALARKASSLDAGGKRAEAEKVAREATRVFEELQAAGDKSDDVKVGLALAIYARTNDGLYTNFRADLETATGLLRPLLATGRASRSAKLTLADMLQFLAHAQRNPADGVLLCEESRKILTEMGAGNLSDLTAASIYGDVTDTQSRLTMQLGQIDEAERLSLIVADMAEKVLDQRPGDLRAMRNRYYSANMLGRLAADRHDLAKSEANFRKSAEAGRNLTLFNPADSLSWTVLIQGGVDLGLTYFEQGKVNEALRTLREAAALEHDPRNKTGSDPVIYWAWREQMGILAQAGNLPEARAALAELRRVEGEVVKDRNLDKELEEITDVDVAAAELELLAATGDYTTIHARAVEMGAQIGKIKVLNPGNQGFRAGATRLNRRWLAEAALRLGHFEEAVTATRESVENPEFGRMSVSDKAEAMAHAKLRQGQALLGAGRRAEALGPLGEAEAYFRQQQARGAGDTSFRQYFSRSLYYLSRAQADDDAGRARRRALLDDAATVLGGLSFEAQQLVASKELMRWVATAQASL
jgi:tetratricopeptide (TPR) repeat protein